VSHHDQYLSPDASTYFIKNSPNDSATTGHKGRGSIGNATSTCPKSGWSDLHLTSNRSWSPMNFPTKTSPEIQSFGAFGHVCGTVGFDVRGGPEGQSPLSVFRVHEETGSASMVPKRAQVGRNGRTESGFQFVPIPRNGRSKRERRGKRLPTPVHQREGLGPSPRSLAIAACTSVVVIVGRTAHPARTCPPDKTSPTLGSIPAMISSTS